MRPQQNHEGSKIEQTKSGRFYAMVVLQVVATKINVSVGFRAHTLCHHLNVVMSTGGLMICIIESIGRTAF